MEATRKMHGQWTKKAQEPVGNAINDVMTGESMDAV